MVSTRGAVVIAAHHLLGLVVVGLLLSLVVGVFCGGAVHCDRLVSGGRQLVSGNVGGCGGGGARRVLGSDKVRRPPVVLSGLGV